MNKALFSFFILFAIFTPHIQSAASVQPDQVIEIFRHGARGPTVATYDSSWESYGVLTAVGMRQQYILGKVLTEKYSNLFGSTYDYNTIYMLSDTTPRCIQSAIAQFYGIYLNTGPALRNDYPTELAVPPFEDPRVKSIADSLPNIEAMPHNYIPNIVNIVNATNAYIFQSSGANLCPNTAQWIQENQDDNKTKEAMVLFNDTINNLNKYLDSSHQISSLPSLSKFEDALQADIAENKSLFGITDPKLINNLTHAMTWTSMHNYYGQEVQRQISSFGLVDASLQQMANFRQGKSYNKLALYSAHDSNIFAILAALGVINEECILANFNASLENKTLPYPNCHFPTFASSLIIEFYNATESYVKMYYNNILVPLCNEQRSCSYEDFILLMRNASGNLTLDTYYDTCGNYNPPKLAHFMGSPIDKNDSSLGDNNHIEMWVILGLVFLIMALIGKIVLNKKTHEEMMKKVQANYDSEYQTMRNDLI